MSTRVLTVVICAAGPAVDAAKLTGMACDQGWQVQAFTTPAALGFIDPAAIGTDRPAGPQPGQPARVTQVTGTRCHHRGSRHVQNDQ